MRIWTPRNLLTLSAAALAVLTPAVRADELTFDNTCGDFIWQTCCDCGDLKCINWSRPPAIVCPPLPTSSDDLTIVGDCTVGPAPLPGVAARTIEQSGGTFTLNHNMAVADLAVFDGPFVWNAGSIDRAGGAAGQHVIVNGGLMLQGDAIKTLHYFGGIRLTNTGAGTWSGDGEWRIGMLPGGCCPAIFENTAGATFNVQTDAAILQTEYGIGVIENDGTLIKSSGGLSDWAVSLKNTGLVHIQNGELRLTRAGLIGGNWMIDPGAEAAFAGNFHEFEPGVVIQGRAVVKLSGNNVGAYVNDDITIDDLTVADDGRLSGTGVLRIAGTLTSEGGDCGVHINILPGGHLQETGVGHFYGKLDIEGTANISNGSTMGCFNQLMTILPGGVFTIDDGCQLNQTGLVNQPVENHGTIRKPPTGGVATIANFFNQFLNNRSDGTIAVEGGTMRCLNRLDQAGTIHIAAGAEFSQESWANYRAGAAFTGDGFFHINHAPNNFIDDGVDLAFPNLRMSGMTNSGHGISGPGSLTVTNEFDLKGGRINVPQLTIEPSATMNVSGPDFAGGSTVVIENFGQTNITAQSLGFGVFNNRPGGVVDIQSDFAFVNWFGNGPFNNEGVFKKSAGNASDIGASITNSGIVRAESGTIVFFAAHNTFTQNAGLTELAGGGIRVTTMTLNGGVVRGAGMLTANVTNNGASVEPGASPGILNIASNTNPVIAGNYTQGEAASLRLEIGGTEPGGGHDQLVVSGTAALGGGLNLQLVDGFMPKVGDEFVILTAASRTGTFSRVSGVQIAQGVQLEVRYNPADVTVRVVKGGTFPGDLNDDNRCRIDDLSMLLASYGYCDGEPEFIPAADIDGSGCVDMDDLLILLLTFGV